MKECTKNTCIFFIFLRNYRLFLFAVELYHCPRGCDLHDLVFFFFFIDYRCNRISKLDANSLNYLDLVHHCVISREKKSQRLKGA